MSKRIYTTSNVQQLIDLNEDLTNFKLKFTLSSKNNQEFDMVIADQHTIDNTPNELEFKRVKNTISGTIVSDKNVFQNHFLILKSAGDTPAEVEVIINKREIPANTENETKEQSKTEEKNLTFLGERNRDEREQVRGEQVRGEQVRGEQVRGEQVRGEQVRGERDRVEQFREKQMREKQLREQSRLREQVEKEEYEKLTPEEESTTWIDIKLIIIVLICILVGVFIYNMISKNSSITNNLNVPNVSIPVPSAPNGSSVFDLSLNQNLFRKLNNIPI